MYNLLHNIVMLIIKYVNKCARELILLLLE